MAEQNLRYRCVTAAHDADAERAANLDVIMDTIKTAQPLGAEPVSESEFDGVSDRALGALADGIRALREIGALAFD